MRKKFSNNWKSSKQPRKQIKYRANAPKHIKHKFQGSRLSKELSKKYEKRSIAVRRDDTVKVMRGQFKDKTGKIESVNLKNSKVIITGIEISKKDGTKTRYPIHASNIMITSINVEDKKRVKKLKNESNENKKAEGAK